LPSVIGSQTIAVRRANTRFAPTLVSALSGLRKMPPFLEYVPLYDDFIYVSLANYVFVIRVARKAEHLD